MADPTATPGQHNTPPETVTDPATLATSAPPEAKSEAKPEEKLFGKDESGKPVEKATPDPSKPEVKAEAPKEKAEAKPEEKVEAKPEEKPVELKLPEDVPLDKEAYAKFGELAKSQKIAPATQQALIDFQAQMARDAIKAHTAAIAETYAGWRTESLKSFTKAELNHATTAVGVLGDQQITDFFNETKLGDHPMVIRLLARFGALMAEDTFETGGGKPATQKQNGATLLYGPGTEKRN